MNSIRPKPAGHRRDSPHLSLLELRCPCCALLTIPSVRRLTCDRHPWSSCGRYLVGWFCADCGLLVRYLRFYSSRPPAQRFLRTLTTAARRAWVSGEEPDLPPWVLPRPPLRRPPAPYTPDHIPF